MPNNLGNSGKRLFLYKIFRIFRLLVDLIFSFVISVIEMMTDGKSVKNTSKKRKLPTQTVAHRSAISANWQALLASDMLSGDSPVKADVAADRFTGTFRRARKKNNTNTLPNMQALDITQHTKKSDKTDLPNGEVLRAHDNKRTGEKKLTNVLAMDCEMVGIGAGGEEHMIARVSLVNRFGDCVYDKFVKAREEVTNYRTKISGIRKEDMINGEEFTTVQKEVSELLRGRTLVGHSLKNDLAVLFLSHPKRQIRDTAKYKPFRKLTHGNTPSLKFLAAELLGAEIQGGEHSSVVDARAAMQLYLRVSKDWEHSLSGKRKHQRQL